MAISIDKNDSLTIPTRKSLYIEMFFDDKKLSSGTAFLLAKNRSSHCTLITNRHNVTGRHQETGQCLSRMAAIPNAIVINFHKEGGGWTSTRLPLYRDDGSPWWIEHPALGKEADVVALNLSWGSDVIKMPYYLETELDRCSMEIEPAEPVSVIGFPFGISSSQKYPVWATGFLAQELSLVSEETPVFLIDCRTRPGQSGSPVIAYRPDWHRKKNADSTVITSLQPGIKQWEFLGVYCGRVNEQSDLGKVWHVSILEALLDQAEKTYLTGLEKKKEMKNKSPEPRFNNSTPHFC